MNEAIMLTGYIILYFPTIWRFTATFKDLMPGMSMFWLKDDQY